MNRHMPACLFLAAMLLSVAAEGIMQLEKQSYRQGELVKILFTENVGEEYSIAILSPGNAYRFLGLPSGSLLFSPQETGRHVIELSSGDALIESMEFNVGEITIAALMPGKPVYNADEDVLLHFNTSLSQFTIEVSDGEKKYYFSEPASPVVFKPRSAGSYRASLKDGNNALSSIGFTVAPKSKKFSLKDHDGREIKGVASIFKDAAPVAQGSLESLETHEFEASGEYGLELEPDIKGVKKIRFKSLKLDKNFDLGIEDLSDQRFLKSYAVDPTRLSFSEAEVTGLAEGKALYKCADWSFSDQVCNGDWVKVMDLVPGSEYIFTITPNDPAYGEAGDVPLPHPVRGIIFQANNLARAENGMPVRIRNLDNGMVADTSVNAPPVPALKGSYSADIYADDLDRITVLSWNLTHYGSANSTLAAATTYVNVSITQERGSETNVTVSFPGNMTVFNITERFNVTALIGILVKDAAGCSAVLSLSNPVAQPVPGEDWTLPLGDLQHGRYVYATWNLTASALGGFNLTVSSSCASDKEILENLNTARATGLTVADRTAPDITVFSPLDNMEVTNPVRLVFNVSDLSDVENCSLYLNSMLYQTIHNPPEYSQITLNITLDAGDYDWQLECFDLSSYHNRRLTEDRLFLLPSWHYYYGNLSSRIALSDSSDSEQFSWDDLLTANIYIIESGSQIGWHDLEALGRDILGQPSPDDFFEADKNLSMEGFSDSINNTFTRGSQPAMTSSLAIYNNVIENIPIANSTSYSYFYTGILWDTSDGGQEYDGTQDLVFVTVKNETHTGRFGEYEYEARVPPLLKEHKLGTGTVSFYVEIT